MKKSPIAKDLSFGGIPTTSASKVVSDSSKYEKGQTPVIDIAALRSISRIVQAIKVRIDAGETTRAEHDTQTCPAGNPSGPTPTRSNCGKKGNRKKNR